MYSTNMKRRANLIITVVIAFLVVGAVFIYAFFVRPRRGMPPPVPGKVTRVTTPGVSPPATSPILPVVLEKLTKISDQALINGYSVKRDTGDILFFDQGTGKLRAASADGRSIRDLNSSVFQNVISTFWAPAGTKIILESIDPMGNRVFAIFDYASGKTIALDPKIRAVAWDPSGSRIAFHFFDPASTGKKYIGTMRADGTGSRTVIAISLPHVKLAWPHVEALYFVEKPAPLFQTTVFRLNPSSGALEKLFDEFFGTEISPSPDGTVLLISGTSDPGGNFVKTRFLDTRPPTRGPLASLQLTFASKCAWVSDNTSLYCALPEQTSLEYQTAEGSEGIASPLNWPFSRWSGKRFTSDAWLKINWKTGAAEELLPRTGMDVDGPVLGLKGDSLIFFNRPDQVLYRLKL